MVQSYQFQWHKVVVYCLILNGNGDGGETFR